MISVITVTTSSKQSRKRGEGIGSRSQDFFGILRIICLTCSELTAWKVSSGIPEKKTESARRGVESRLLRIVSIFSVKKFVELTGKIYGGNILVEFFIILILYTSVDTVVLYYAFRVRLILVVVALLILFFLLYIFLLHIPLFIFFPR